MAIRVTVRPVFTLSAAFAEVRLILTPQQFMNKQIIRRDSVADAHLPSQLHPLLRQIYARRGVNSGQELEQQIANMLPANLLKGIERAVALLLAAHAEQWKVVIVGDFDADGATSTATLMHGLRLLGFLDVDYMVPNRFDFGYGLSVPMAEMVIASGAQLLITVDNGISCYDGVARAKSAGLKVLVTDHHLPGARLPEADAIVNPNQHDCPFPSKALAGVGVAFYLLVAARQAMREAGIFSPQNQPNLAELLDLVALGTVADVVPLDCNNRLLVQQGIQRIRRGQMRPGIRALIEVANRRAERLTASDFGFALGPRLNAAGRLDDMALGISCLLASDDYSARRMAQQLDLLNSERREIEAGMQQEAQRALQKLAFKQGDMPFGVCLYQADWHQGVIGILAGRIKEQQHRPTICFARAEHANSNGEYELKGSARSIVGLHMRDVLELLNSRHPGLILKFGGHAMAAGLSINERDFAKFAELFNELVQQQVPREALQAVILSDGELPSDCYTLDFAELLRNAGPFGQAFPEPVFDDEFTVVQQRLLTDKHLKLVLQHKSGVVLDAIWFNCDVKAWPNPLAKRVHMAFTLDINEFRGQFNLQCMVQHLVGC